MTQIFISYKRSDEEFALKVYSSLVQRIDATIWLDVVSIRAGEDWSDAIQNGLSASDVLLLIVTPDSMASSNVADEWKYFHCDTSYPVRHLSNHFSIERITS